MRGLQHQRDLRVVWPPYLLSSQTRHHLFLATHEALTNILKHSGATGAKVSITCSASTLEVVTSDNGKGLESSTTEAKTDGAGADSRDGLRNMRQRLADI